MNLNPICHDMAYLTIYLVLTLLSKMVWLKESTNILLRPVTILSQAFMPFSYWSFAAQTVVSLINILPTFELNWISPQTKLYSTNPDLTQLKVFGCACYPNLRRYNTHKLEPRTRECIFIGYPPNSKAYLCLYQYTNRVYTSRHVLFNESKFPFSSTVHTIHASNSTPTSIPPWFSNQLYLHSTNQPSLLGSYPTSPHVSLPSYSPTLDSSTPASAEPPLPTSVTHLSSSLPTDVIPTSSTLQPSHPTNTHSMQTRSKSGISKPKSKLCYKVAMDYTFTEPPSYKIASQYPKWCEAMDADFLAPQRQHTWSLIPAPLNVNLVGCKWDFKLKLNSDESQSTKPDQLLRISSTGWCGFSGDLQSCG